MEPSPSFTSPPLAPFLLEDLLGALLHRKDAGTHLLRRMAENMRLNLSEQHFTESNISRKRTCLEQSLFFPQAGMLLNILNVACERSDKKPVPAPRTQTHIHAVEKTLGCNFADVIDQVLPQFQFLNRIIR